MIPEWLVTLCAGDGRWLVLGLVALVLGSVVLWDR